MNSDINVFQHSPQGMGTKPSRNSLRALRVSSTLLSMTANADMSKFNQSELAPHLYADSEPLPVGIPSG